MRSLVLQACVLGLLSAVAGSTGSAQATRSLCAAATRARCSPNPIVAADFIVPPAPFKARVISVRRSKLPPFEPVGRGPLYKRLYLVTFYVIRGNPVLPQGHRYTQFAYVTRKSLSAPWCFLKGGSGP